MIVRPTELKSLSDCAEVAEIHSTRLATLMFISEINYWQIGVVVRTHSAVLKVIGLKPTNSCQCGAGVLCRLWCVFK